MMVMMLSCKSDEIDPVDKFIGVYFADTYPKDFAYPAGSLASNTISIRKQSSDLVSVTIYNKSYKTILTPYDGYQSFSKDFEFPNCKMVALDTTGIAYLNPHFVKIIDTSNNMEIGKIKKWDGVVPVGGDFPLNYLRFDFNATVLDSIRIGFTGYKLRD